MDNSKLQKWTTQNYLIIINNSSFNQWATQNFKVTLPMILSAKKNFKKKL